MTPTDIPYLVHGLHQLKLIVTTGELATQTLCSTLSVAPMPKVNEWKAIPVFSQIEQRQEVFLYRLPSSSRAYPLAFSKKAEAYRQMYMFAGLL